MIEVYSETSGGEMLKKLSLVVLLLLFLSTIPQLMLSQEEPQVTVEVNPNLELFAVVYILAFNGSDEFIIAPRDYVNDVLTYFAPYANSGAVRLIRDLIPQSFSYYVRDRSIRKFARNLVKMPYLGNMSESDPLLTEPYKQLVKFAKESNFIQFYNEHKEVYEKAVTPLKEVLPNDIPEKFVKFFGWSYTSYKVELSYSLWIHPYSEYTRDSAICIMTAQGDHLVRGMVMLHEFTHPYINRLMDSHPRIFENLTYYVDEVQRQLPAWTSLDPEPYSNEYYWNELLTESFAVYLAKTSNTSLMKMARYRELQDLSLGYYLLDEVVRELKAFEQSKKPGETFSDYLPVLVSHLKGIANSENVASYFKRKVPVTQLWFFDRAYSAGRIVIVYGSQNPDKRGNEYDKETALRLKEHLSALFSTIYDTSPSIIIKSDREVTAEDLKENLILVGGPVANNLTKNVQDKMPIKFILNGTWGLKRDPDVVGEFSAFFSRGNTFDALPLSAPIPQEGFGVVEVIRNPWSDKSFILIVAGVDRYSTRRMIENVKIFSPSYIIEGDEYIEAGFYTQTGGI